MDYQEFTIDKQFNLNEPIRKAYETEVVSILENERAIIHWISSENKDRADDIVIQKGIDDSDFNNSPTVLFNHNSYYPIAHSAWRSQEDNGTKAKTKFSKTPFANDVYTWHKEKVLNSWSISFLPMLKNGYIDPEFTKYDRETGITTFIKSKLLEYSSVSVPANAEAVDVLKSMTKSLEGNQILDVAGLKLVIEKQLSEYTTKIDEIAQLKSQLQDLLEIKNSFGKLAELEQSILELSEEIQSKTNQIKTDPPKVETLDQEHVNAIVKRVVREVSQKNK